MGRTYVRTQATLKRMLDRKHPKTGEMIRGTVSRDRDYVHGEAFVYWLKESDYVWKKGDQKRDHERACGDLFVAYHPYLVHWDNAWTSYEKSNFAIEKWEFEYDRRMVLPAAAFTQHKRSTPFVWEVDGASEPIYDERHRERYSDARWRKSINGKIDKYLRFAKAHPTAWFYVLFATFEPRFGGKFGSPAKRANDIVELLLDRGLTRGQFLVTTVSRAKADPMGRIFLKPGSPDLHSLRDV